MSGAGGDSAAAFKGGEELVLTKRRCMLSCRIVTALTYLPLQISCFIRGGPGQHPWVTETGS